MHFGCNKCDIMGCTRVYFNLFLWLCIHTGLAKGRCFFWGILLQLERKKPLGSDYKVDGS